MTLDPNATLTRSTKPRHTKKKIAAGALCLLLIGVGAFLYANQPSTEPVPKPAAAPPVTPEVSAQDEWFTALAALKTQAVPDYSCTTYVTENVDLADGNMVLMDRQLADEVATFVYGTPSQELLFPEKVEGVPFAACAIIMTDVYSLGTADDPRRPDLTLVEDNLNAMGYTGSEDSGSNLPLAPKLNLSTSENAADALKDVLSSYGEYASTVTNDEAKNSTTFILSDSIVIAFMLESAAPAAELKALRSQVSDEDYEFMTEQALDLLASQQGK